jgi:hypothetical protein
MSLSPDEVKEIAELEIRRYFDHYLEKVHPRTLDAAIEAHDSDDKAHGSVEKRMDRAVWVFVGVAVASGGVGALVNEVMAAVGG